MEGDLQYRRFAFVPPDKAAVLDALGNDWSFIWAHVQRARADSEEAVYCYALGRNDACIFHAMRVSELGLRILAKQFRVKVKRGVEFAGWHDLIVAIDKKATAESNKPASDVRQKRLEFFSKAADRCERMNNIWRREISHARRGVKYPDGEALDALKATQELMSIIAERISKQAEKAANSSRPRKVKP
jgi:hypothetical protein